MSNVYIPILPLKARGQTADIRVKGVASVCHTSGIMYDQAHHVILIVGDSTMPTTVGPKGQVVIEKAIRDRLGVKPGAVAIQTVMGDHVEIRFLSPEHGESLFGALASYAGAGVADREWGTVKRQAWTAAARSAEPVPPEAGRTRPPRRGTKQKRRP